jgi:predicted membrane-bound spermidine synthase
MYEVVLTRLLSVTCWYYLAFVAISMAMFGMTAGALAVQLRPDLFEPSRIPARLAQSSFYLALSLPLALVIMLAVPVGISMAVEASISFLLTSAIISVPFFFSGITVCLALTRSPFPIGRVYAVDLFGAGFGCLGSVILLELMDAPSGMFVISGLLFLGAACFAAYAGDRPFRQRASLWAFGMLVIAGLNASSLHGIQPIWTKERIDLRTDLAAEVWNPISKVRVLKPSYDVYLYWGPSPLAPPTHLEAMYLDVDNDARSVIMNYQGDLKPFGFLRYDVTSLGAELRAGGTAAIIGVGGGRDVINCALNGFRRIVGVEVNSAIVNLTTHRFGDFSGFASIPHFELHRDEGRSYLTRTQEKFDMIQASMVDTWAATSAGALTLSENALYTVDAWRVFYRHLKPGGLITFSRWDGGPAAFQTYRLFALAWATLLSEGVENPGPYMALVGSDVVATILVSNRPLSEQDLYKIQELARLLKFHVMFLPGQEPTIPELQAVASSRTLQELRDRCHTGGFDYTPVFDSSPYFFDGVRLKNLPRFLAEGATSGSPRALLVVFAFTLAAVILVALTIFFPVSRWARRQSRSPSVSVRGIIYFVALGIGFILVEIAMMQQLSIFLGEPMYSLVVVLAGLILSAGAGSLVSDRIRPASGAATRALALAACAVDTLYAAAVVPAIHQFIAGMLWQRVLISLALVMPCGFLMGFCFPLGLRWMVAQRQENNLPWMWALNGAAGTLGSFVAVVLSMETSIRTCTLTGASCYLLAALTLFVPAAGSALSGSPAAGAADRQGGAR